MQDNAQIDGRYTQIMSPIIHGGRPQCITFRYYRMGASCNMGDLYVYLEQIETGSVREITRRYGCNWGPHWRTVRWEVREPKDYRVMIRVYAREGWGNQAFDDMTVVDDTCKLLYHVDSLTGSKSFIFIRITK